MIKTEGKTVEQVVEEIFALLVKQGKRCVNANNECAYGNTVGEHCAVGFLLHETKQYMDFGGSVRDLCSSLEHLGPNHNFIINNVSILNLAQRVHDRSNNRGREFDSRALKRRIGRDTPALDEWLELMKTA